MFEIKNKVTINELDSIVNVLQNIDATLNALVLVSIVFVTWKIIRYIVSDFIK
jgi:hypothetical protein|tara:strand:+ start:1273 stop:1431 length:159 start_codon:yes stop_codon:yes gene_type:complete